MLSKSEEPTCPDWLQPLTIGVVMLNTRFPRASGDIGNPATLFGKGIYRRVSVATVESVISDKAIVSDVANRIVEATLELVALGADAVLTSCGFLQEIQARLQQCVSVPVVSSSLDLLPDLLSSPGDSNAPQVGIMTFDASRLSERHLGGSEPAGRCVLVGMESSSHFHPVIAEDRTEADPERLRSDVLDAAVTMAAKKPQVVLLECTNLAPWKREIEKIVGVPTLDLMDALQKRVGESLTRSDKPG